VGNEVGQIQPFDIVRVPAMTWHQFRAAASVPLGFLCLVTTDRDRGARPNEEEFRALRSNPEIDAFIRP
jgi:mannose-6-phosphate isomerase-like protein (cupin superfamily)